MKGPGFRVESFLFVCLGQRETERERELSSKFVRQFGAKTFPQTSVRGYM